VPVHSVEYPANGVTQRAIVTGYGAGVNPEPPRDRTARRGR
jgi:hypothetical protein